MVYETQLILFEQILLFVQYDIPKVQTKVLSTCMVYFFFYHKNRQSIQKLETTFIQKI